MSRLRVVDPAAPQGEVSMDDAIRALAARVSADLPTAILVAWEMPGGKVNIVTLPNAETLKRGMADVIYDATHPEIFAAAE